MLIDKITTYQTWWDSGNIKRRQSHDNFYYQEQYDGFSFELTLPSPTNSTLAQRGVTSIYLHLTINDFTTGFSIFSGNIIDNYLIGSDFPYIKTVTIPIELWQPNINSTSFSFTGWLTYESVTSTNVVQGSEIININSINVKRFNYNTKLFYENRRDFPPPACFEWVNFNTFVYQNGEWVPCHININSYEELYDIYGANIFDINNNKLYIAGKAKPSENQRFFMPLKSNGPTVLGQVCDKNNKPIYLQWEE